MATYRWAEGLDKHCSSGLRCIWSTHSLWNESLQAFKTSETSLLFLHETQGSVWESVDYQEFLNAVCREEWKLVGIAWGWLCSQWQGNVDRNLWDRLGNIIPMGGCLSTSTPRGKREKDRHRQTDREGGRERGVITVSAFLFSMVCGSLAIPFQWNTICLAWGIWTHLNCPGALFLSLRLSWNSIPC